MSALRHDSIIDAGDPDYALVEGEAERVAKQAVIIHKISIFKNLPSIIPIIS